MAKPRHTGDAPRSRARHEDAGEQAERLSRTLGESAQQIWLAGVGAFGRAQAEGSKLFEGLVKEGMTLEKATRNLAGTADVMREAVGARVGQARDRATGTLDRLEKVFEARVQRALVNLGVPDRSEMEALRRRVDALSGEPRRTTAAPAVRKSPTRKAPVAKSPARAAASRSPTPRQSPARGGATKPTARTSTRTTPTGTG